MRTEPDQLTVNKWSPSFYRAGEGNQNATRFPPAATHKLREREGERQTDKHTYANKIDEEGMDCGHIHKTARQRPTHSQADL